MAGEKKQFNIHEAKTHFSRLLERVEKGEELVIARNGRPLAKLVPYAEEREPRKLGLLKGKIWVADDFDEVDEEIVRMFEGDAD